MSGFNGEDHVLRLY